MKDAPIGYTEYVWQYNEKLDRYRFKEQMVQTDET